MRLHLPNISSKNWLFLFLGVMSAAIPFTIIQLQQQQTLEQQATTVQWATSQSATALCPADGGTAIIKVTFKNTEPNQPSKAMKVIATDQQTGKNIDLGVINGQQTKSANIQTGKKSLQAGTVKFDLSWADGHSGTDTRTANYQEANNCGSEISSCPTGTEQIDQVSGYVVANTAPMSHNYSLSLPRDTKVTVIGSAKEGHPEDCPNGPACNQGQLFEEFNVAINGTVFGVTTDKGAAVDAWYEVGPWQTQSVISKGTATFTVAHRKRNPKSTEPDSVDFKLTLCIDSPRPSPSPTSPVPSPTICPTLGPVQNIKIECPNCP